MSEADGGRNGETGDRSLLRRVRTEPQAHWVAVVVAAAVGLVLASLHWVGLVVGGGLVALTATSLKRGLLAGLGFGVLVVFVWAVRFLVGGVLSEVLAMGQISAIAVAMALVLSVLGSLLRGVV